MTTRHREVCLATPLRDVPRLDNLAGQVWCTKNDHALLSGSRLVTLRGDGRRLAPVCRPSIGTSPFFASFLSRPTTSGQRSGLLEPTLEGRPAHRRGRRLMARVPVAVRGGRYFTVAGRRRLMARTPIAARSRRHSTAPGGDA